MFFFFLIFAGVYVVYYLGLSQKARDEVGTTTVLSPN
jgi:hypothetical protein